MIQSNEKKLAYIITFHRALNYGAILQTYALETVLERFGLRVEVVDFIPDWIKVRRRNYPSVASYFKRVLMWFHFIPMQKRIKKTKLRYFEETELRDKLPRAEYYFAGSDQVWNEKLTKGGREYFLSFAPEEAIKIGYAVSMGNREPSEKFRDIISPLIRRFRYIGVREEYVRGYINREFGTSDRIYQVLDPTLLLTKEDYSSLVGTNRGQGRYILVYACMHDENLYEMANLLKRLMNIELVNVGYHFSGPDKHEYIKGPENWIMRIRDAECIITNSFHGSAFAVLFQKKVFVVPNSNPVQSGLNARFLDFLHSVGLDQVVVHDESELAARLSAPVDYSKVLARLEELKNESIAFLRMVLGG